MPDDTDTALEVAATAICSRTGCAYYDRTRGKELCVLGADCDCWHDAMKDARAAIAAYEQAKWRPAEEAEVGDFVLIHNGHDKNPWHGRRMANGWEAPYEPTIFRPFPPLPEQD